MSLITPEMISQLRVELKQLEDQIADKRLAIDHLEKAFLQSDKAARSPAVSTAKAATSGGGDIEKPKRGRPRKIGGATQAVREILAKESPLSTSEIAERAASYRIEKPASKTLSRVIAGAVFALKTQHEIIEENGKYRLKT